MEKLMLDLTKIEHGIITDHKRRQAAAKVSSDQLYALELALQEAVGLIVSQLTIFENTDFSLSSTSMEAR